MLVFTLLFAFAYSFQTYFHLYSYVHAIKNICSRFLARIKTLLSTITRPTRRGKLFNNFKPRKPILSRHFKLVNVHFDIPKLNIIYWSSASEEYGCLLEAEHFNLDSSHKLELVPFLDNLKRRPKPCWYVELMKCQLAQTKTYLMAPNKDR